MGIQKHDLSDPAISDVVEYIKIFRGVAFSEVPKPFRYRVLTPYLARLVPFRPEFVAVPSASRSSVDPDKILKFKFGVVNWLGLAATSTLLFVFCRYMYFSSSESLLASFIFLTSFYVVWPSGIPSADPLAFLFLMLGIVATFNNWYFTLFISFTIGMFAKETTALVIPAIFLLPGTVKSKFIKLGLCLPGLVGYMIFRWLISPTNLGQDTNYSVSSITENLEAALIPSELWLRGVVEGGFAFGIVWFLALHGWLLIRREKTAPLYRLSFLIPVVIATPLVLGTNLGRIWFLAFPVIIPLSLLSLRQILNNRNQLH
jgi:hypothetical protein